MTNAFDDDNATYTVLVNAVGQHSLWPVSISIPKGWDVAHGPSAREASLTYVQEHWTDLRTPGQEIAVFVRTVHDSRT